MLADALPSGRAEADSLIPLILAAKIRDIFPCSRTLRMSRPGGRAALQDVVERDAVCTCSPAEGTLVSCVCGIASLIRQWQDLYHKPADVKDELKMTKARLKRGAH